MNCVQLVRNTHFWTVFINEAPRQEFSPLNVNKRIYMDTASKNYI